MKYALLCAAVLATTLPPLCAAAELSESDFLGDFPVVLTASRLMQPAQDAPKSISVIDRAMIEASGFQNLAELFQLVPGYYVAQRNGYTFAVTSGLVDEYSRQMQVLVDGRSVYQPTMGGVQWDALPLAIADIDRIEVVHGPDADSYGANSMMGVINILTRRPDEAGTTLSVTAGSENRRDFLFRWAGGEASKQRVTLGWQQNEGLTGLNDSTHAPLFTYSGDIDVGPGRSLNLQMGYVGGTRGAGDFAQYGNGTSLPHDQRVDSQFQQLDYRAGLSDGGEWLFKAYHNYLMDKETVPVGPGAAITTYHGIPVYLLPGSYELDLLSERWHVETQWNRPLNDAVRFSLGAYARHDAVNSPLNYGTDQDLVAASWGAFSHAEWRLAKAWLLNAGMMWEYHDLVGSRVSPHLSLSWQPSPNHTLRLGVARAYRDPLEFEKNANFALTLMTTAGPYTERLYGSNPGIQPESVLSREVAYLGRWPEYGLTGEARIHMDSLGGLIDLPPGEKPPYHLTNVGESLDRGVDATLRWRLAPHAFVQMNYAFLHIDTTLFAKPYFPPLLVSLLASYRFDHGIDVSLGYYQSAALVMISSDRPPAYHRTNLRIAREFKQDGHPVRLAFILQGLGADNYGYNYSAPSPARDLLPRQALLQCQVEF